MNTLEKKLLLDFCTGEISYEELKKRYPVFIDRKYILNELENAYETKDSKAVFYLIILGYNEDFDQNIGNMLCKLLIEDWHKEHEEIARILQFEIKVPECIDNIVRAMHLKFDYLVESGDYESFARKCAFALADLKTEHSLRKLKELSESENEIIRKVSLEQLNELDTND